MVAARGRAILTKGMSGGSHLAGRHHLYRRQVEPSEHKVHRGVLHVIAQMDRGGAERIVLQLALAAKTQGRDVTIVSGGGAWESECLKYGVEHHRIPIERRSPLRLGLAAWHLRRIVRSSQCQVIHAHNVRASVATRLAVIGIGNSRRLTTLHGVAPRDRVWTARILRQCAPLVVGCSAAVTRGLIEGGFPAARTRTIPNGAELASADPERTERMARKLGLASGPIVVGIGRLVAQKNWSLLIEAAAMLPKFDGLDVVVVGTGPLLHELEHGASRAGGRVRFVGPVDDVAALLANATCMVSSSSWEGLPMVHLEAASLGVPIVTTSVDGVADVFPPGTAFVVPPGDPNALALALTAVITTTSLQVSLGSEARLLSTKWTVASMTTAYLALYDSNLD